MRAGVDGEMEREVGGGRDQRKRIDRRPIYLSTEMGV
jgi:hypothetical protein